MNDPSVLQHLCSRVAASSPAPVAWYSVSARSTCSTSVRSSTGFGFRSPSGRALYRVNDPTGRSPACNGTDRNERIPALRHGAGVFGVGQHPGHGRSGILRVLDGVQVQDPVVNVRDRICATSPRTANR